MPNRIIGYPISSVRQADSWHHPHKSANQALEIPNHRVERVDEMTISYILRAIQAYATTAEGRQDSLGDDLYQRIAYEAVKRVRVDGAALTLFSS